MRFMVLIFLTCATGGLSSGLTDITSIMGEAMKVLVFGGQVDDTDQKTLYGVGNTSGRSLNNSLDNNTSDLNTTDKLELATESIANGIDVIMQEIFGNSPVLQDMYDTQIRIAVRIALSEMIKGLVQLRTMPLRRLSEIVFNYLST